MPFLVLALFGSLYALPLWLAPFPVMQDVPAHAEMGCQLLRLWRDEPLFTSVLMVHPQPWANSVPTVVLALLFAMAPSFAMVKLVLSAAVVTWPVSVGVLLARFGRSPWLALLCVPLCYDLAWSYGFLQFICAKPLLVLCVAQAKGLADVPRGRSAVGLALLLLLLFMTHSLAWMVGSACVAVVLVLHARRARDLLHLWPVMVAALLTLPFFVASRGAAAAGAKIEARDAVSALRSLWPDLGQLRDGGPAPLVFLAIAAALLVLLFLQRAQLRDASRPRLSLLACGAMLFVAWLWGPPVLPQVSVVSPRLLSLAVMFLLVGVPGAMMPPRAALGLGVAVALASCVHVADVTHSYRRFSSQEMGDFHALLERVPRGARVATQYASPFSPFGRHNALWHWGKLGCLKQGAVTDDLFAYRKTAYVEVRPDAQAFIRPPHRMKPAALAQYDMLLLRGDPRAAQPLQSATSAPVLRETFSTGSWHLYAIEEPPRP